jgi:hypothetical protein
MVAVPQPWVNRHSPGLVGQLIDLRQLRSAKLAAHGSLLDPHRGIGYLYQLEALLYQMGAGHDIQQSEQATTAQHSTQRKLRMRSRSRTSVRIGAHCGPATLVVEPAEIGTPIFDVLGANVGATVAVCAGAHTNTINATEAMMEAARKAGKFEMFQFDDNVRRVTTKVGVMKTQLMRGANVPVPPRVGASALRPERERAARRKLSEPPRRLREQRVQELREASRK